jgi:hypothetical protein
MLLPKKVQHVPADAGAGGWTVHVEIQFQDHPPDAVTQAAAEALVEELHPWSAAAFGGRGVVTLIANQPASDAPTGSDPPEEARALDAALAVVSRFGQVRRVQPVGDATGAGAGSVDRVRSSR